MSIEQLIEALRRENHFEPELEPERTWFGEPRRIAMSKSTLYRRKRKARESGQESWT